MDGVIIKIADLMNSREVADLLRVQPCTVRKFVQRGQIASHKIGGKRLFAVQDVNEFISRNRQEATNGRS